MVIGKRLVLALKPFLIHFPAALSIYRGVRDQLSAMAKPVPTPWGFKLTGNIAMAEGSFEPVETNLVRKILKDVDILVNVGANIGYYCCHALGMNKEVIAFEPIPRNLRCLCQNIKGNGWSGAEIYPIALSNFVGVLEIYGGDTGASILKGWAGTPESYVTLVPSSTMDIVVGRRLQGRSVLVLVDIEGAENWMLEGATEMLTQEPKPIWLVEITTNEHQPAGTAMNPHFKNTFQFFFRNGYKAFNVDQEMQPVTQEQVDMVSSGHLKFKTHNFLFCDLNKAI